MKALTMGFENYDGQEFAKPATMYVLRHFQLSLERKTTSKHHMKKTTLDLMPGEQPDLDKTISSEIKFVVSKVRFSADWFTIGDYLNLWKTYFTEFLNKNTMVRKSLRAFQPDSDDTNEQFGLLINLLKEMMRMLEASYDKWHKKMMAEFLESDLPFELYNLYSISYITKISVMRSFVADLTKLRTKLHLARSNERKITSELTEFEKSHRRLSEMLMKTSRSESTLMFFLSAANARELEDLFRTKPLALNSNTEKKTFEEYLGEFRQSLFELTRCLDKRHLDEDIKLHFSDSELFDDFEKNLRKIVLKHA